MNKKYSNPSDKLTKFSNCEHRPIYTNVVSSDGRSYYWKCQKCGYYGETFIGDSQFMFKIGDPQLKEKLEAREESKIH